MSVCIRRLSLCAPQSAEIELVVIAQERTPLAARGTRPGLVRCTGEEARVGRRKRVELVLFDRSRLLDITPFESRLRRPQ
jgi:hypothetical protein